MTITTKDIARIVGVSQSTVSRSLNNSCLISDETRNKVLKVAKELGFEFNANARSLSTNKTGTIGVIYPENYVDLNVNLFLSTLHNQLRDSLEREDLDMIVTFPENRFTKGSSIRRLVTRKKVDGLIIVVSKLNQEILAFLNSSRIPFVFLHNYVSNSHLGEVNRVYTDHLKGGYLATEHLLKLGYRKIICIAADSDEDEFKLRTEGYKAALSDYGIFPDDSLILFGNLSFQSGYEVVMKNIEMFKKASAVFAQNDMMALGAKEALHELGIVVPDDIALVGYDDIELCTYFKPYLTTIHQPREEAALLAVEHLIDLIHSKKRKKAKEIILQPTLVIRQSCGSKQ